MSTFVSMASGRKWLNSSRDNRCHLISHASAGYSTATCGHELQKGAGETGQKLCPSCLTNAWFTDFIEKRGQRDEVGNFERTYHYPVAGYHTPGCGKINRAYFRTEDIGPFRAYQCELLKHGQGHWGHDSPAPADWCRCQDELLMRFEEKPGEDTWLLSPRKLGCSLLGDWQVTKPYSHYEEYRRTITFPEELNSSEEQLLERYVFLKGWGELQAKAAGLYVCFYATNQY
jgi:hypothetical protein